jgi:flagellar hook-basal body complex protein FliE
MSDMYIPSSLVGGAASAASDLASAFSSAASTKTSATASSAATGAASGDSITNPFASVLQSAMQEAGGLESKATTAVTGLLNGSGVEVQDAMMATQKADMAFELALQVRNKAVAAYQSMMTMQF